MDFSPFSLLVVKVFSLITGGLGAEACAQILKEGGQLQSDPDRPARIMITSRGVAELQMRNAWREVCAEIADVASALDEGQNLEACTLLLGFINTLLNSSQSSGAVACYGLVLRLLGQWSPAGAASGQKQAFMKLALAAFVAVSTGLLWRGFALAHMPNRPATLAIGAAAGAANGAFGIGGPPVILFYFASPAGMAAGRASLIAYFLLTDLMGLAAFGHQGLVTLPNLILALLLLPPLTAGVWLGARSFRTADPQRFRKWVLVILLVLAFITAAQGLQSYL